MTSITPDTDQASSEAVVSLTSGSFADYPLSPVLLDALAERGMRAPTPIQAEAIPALLNGRDVVGQARTGSGKTLAFSLPLLDAVDASRASVQALVLAPTRELASQVAAVIADLGTTKGITVALLYGGTSSGPQRTALRRGAQVAVGTPGRVLDLIGQGALWLDQARFVVLDEADEMFDQGFAQDVERIMDKTSNSRQTALFSATMPDWVQQTAARYLYDPETIAVDAGEMPTNPVPHVAYVVPTSNRDRPGGRTGFGGRRDEADMQAKLEALRDLLDHRGEGSTIVFGRTKQGVATLSKQLDRMGYPVGALQGNMTQAERDFVMDAFRSGRINILVATNVAARGLDLADVNLVINVELPESAEMLTHRVGRTGRMGGAGHAITLLAGADLARWQLLTRDVSLPIRQLPWVGAEAALALGDEQQALRQDAQRDQSAPTAARIADLYPNEAEFPMEEGSIMDESSPLERVTNDRTSESSRTGSDQGAATRPTRPVRRPSRQPADGDTGPDRSRPVDEAADLIARALASVGVTNPSSSRSEPTPPTATPRRDAYPERGPVPAREAENPRRADPPGAESTYEPVAARIVGPGSLRGTPRPPWVRDPAERVARWQIGGPLTAGRTVAAAPVSAVLAVPPVPSPAVIVTPAPRSTTPAQPPRAERRVDHAVGPLPQRPADRPVDRAPEQSFSQPVERQSVVPRTESPASPPLAQGGEQPVAQRPAVMPPTVRRRSPAQPIGQPADAAMASPTTQAPDSSANRTVPARPIPTVRASRSRPAPTPAELTPPSSLARSPLLEESVAPVTDATLVDQPIETAAPEATAEAIAEPPVPAIAPAMATHDVPAIAPDAAPELAVATTADELVPPISSPPVRRQSRAKAADQTATDVDAVPESSAPSPDVAAAPEAVSTAEAPVAEPAVSVVANSTEAAEPAPKKSRRASSRRAKAAPAEPPPTDVLTATDTPPTVTEASAEPSPDSQAALDGAGPESTAPEVAEEPAPAPTRSRGRSRVGSGRTAIASASPDPETAVPVDGGSDQTPAVANPVTEPRPARSRSRKTPVEPEDTTSSSSPETAPKRQRASRKTPDPIAPETVPTNEPPAGNRQTPGQRSTGNGPSAGGRDASGRNQRGRRAESGNTSGPERGNTSGPERGNNALAQPARRPPVGSTPGGAPFRRRPMAAPSTRCAACGTPLPKGSTRTYCPACERELAVRSQES